MKNTNTRLAGSAGAVLVTLSALVAGCHTAGSMLVEVDVYKGPLTKTKTVQFGELIGVFAEAEAMMTDFVKAAEGASQRCKPDCHELDVMKKRAEALLTLLKQSNPGDEQLKTLRAIADKLERYDDSGSNALNDAERGTLSRVTQKATTVATQMKVQAFYWAESQIGGIAESRDFRALLVGYSNLISELSNQIASRTDTLTKQLSSQGKGSDLALSDHLKDAGPTDFLHLFDWYQATKDDGLSYGVGRLTPADRARLARRLFADHYWTKINEVHASGQGEVRMALIKDDIGNWSLKSFDNDPGELLDAYRRLTLAGIQTAIQASTGGSTARLDLASQFARGRIGTDLAASVDANRLQAMRRRTRAELQAVKDEADQKGPAMEKEASEARTLWEQAKGDHVAKQVAHKQAVDARVKQEERLSFARQSNVGQDRLSELDAALDEHYKEEDKRRLAVEEAQQVEVEAKSRHDDAQKRHREFMAVLMGEARKSVEIHRRVVEGLKELQTEEGPEEKARAALLGK